MNPLKNQGMFLEEVLNLTHQKYSEENICLVCKIPTNIGLIKTDNKIINQAFFKDSYNCDYIGNYEGHYFEFEAKETYQTFFNWQALRKNQIKKLNQVLATKGLAFLIIYFGQEELFYLVDFAILQTTIINFGQKIPLEWFEQNAKQLNLNSQLKLDYLEYLNFLTNWNG